MILKGNKPHVLRHLFVALSFLEKLFPPCDPLGESSAPASSHHQWVTPALQPFPQPLFHPCEKVKLLQVLDQCLGCSPSSILLACCSSPNLNPWSRLSSQIMTIS